MRLKKGKLIVFAGIFLYLLLCLSSFSLRLLEGELGRYLKLGELGGTLNNHFTCSTPDFPVYNNYSWAYVLMHWTQQTSGFAGLHLLFILLHVGVWLLVLRYCLLHFRWQWVAVVAVFATPVLVLHQSVEPFTITLFFAAVFIFLWIAILENRLKAPYILALIPMQWLWANSHNLFFLGMGIALLGAIQASINNKSDKKKNILCWATALGCALVSWLTPAGYTAHALTYLFESASDDARLGLTNIFYHYWTQPKHYLLYIIFSLLVAFLSWFYSRKSPAMQPLQWFWLGVVLMLGFVIVNSRFNISLVFIVLMPLWSAAGSTWVDKQGAWSALWNTSRSPALAFYLFVPLFFLSQFYYLSPRMPGIWENDWASARFIKKLQIKGNVFNNMPATGFLAYALPDASRYFLDQPYMQQPPSVLAQDFTLAIQYNPNWLELLDKYNFQAIYFYLENEEQEKLLFLGNRLGDEQWALVYHRPEKEALLLRRTPQNEAIIKQYEIPIAVNQ